MTAHAVHQFVASLEPGAVGTHTLEVQQLLRDAGFESDIFAEHVAPRYAGRAEPFTTYGPIEDRRTGHVLLYQMSIGSWVGNYVNGRLEPLVVNYHNLTPSRLLSLWDPDAAEALDWGRRQLANFGRRRAAGLAPSMFSASELVAAGLGPCLVAPLLLDPAAVDHGPDPATMQRLAEAKKSGGADIVFVGRVAPHKDHHGLITAFATYLRLYDSRARLHLIGGPASGLYPGALRKLAAGLGVIASVELTGPVSDGELAAHYECADVFVCLSDHEGFCIPLIEAMQHQVPIVAFSAAAVPETVGPAAVVLPTKEPLRVAAAIHRVVSDRALRLTLQAAGTERAARFAPAASRRAFRAALDEVVRGQ